MMTQFFINNNVGGCQLGLIMLCHRNVVCRVSADVYLIMLPWQEHFEVAMTSCRVRNIMLCVSNVTSTFKRWKSTSVLSFCLACFDFRLGSIGPIWFDLLFRGIVGVSLFRVFPSTAQVMMSGS